jgi:hypothetical protein
VISLEPAVREKVDAILEILDACRELWAILIDSSSAVGPRLIACVAREVEEFPTHDHAAHRAFFSHNPLLETDGWLVGFTMAEAPSSGQVPGTY